MSQGLCTARYFTFQLRCNAMCVSTTHAFHIFLYLYRCVLYLGENKIRSLLSFTPDLKPSGAAGWCNTAKRTFYDVYCASRLLSVAASLARCYMLNNTLQVLLRFLLIAERKTAIAIGEACKKNKFDRVRKSKFLGLTFDAATDITNREKIAVEVRYLDDFMPANAFLTSEHAPGADAKTETEIILKALQSEPLAGTTGRYPCPIFVRYGCCKVSSFAPSL